jgi:hypothetical protein
VGLQNLLPEGFEGLFGIEIVAGQSLAYEIVTFQAGKVIPGLSEKIIAPFVDGVPDPR